MAQNFTDNCYQGDHVGGVDMQAVENNVLCLKSSFSGASAPANQVAGMLHMRTTANKGLRVKNADNNAWLKLLEGDASFKIPVYRNDTAEGWLIDSSVTDRVVALKGGSQAYNVNGGNPAGTWTVPTDHEHKTPGHQHYLSTGNASSNERSNTSNDKVGTDNYDNRLTGQNNKQTYAGTTHWGAVYRYTDSDGSGVWTTDGLSDISTWRPAAIVCTLQYPDLG